VKRSLTAGWLRRFNTYRAMATRHESGELSYPMLGAVSVLRVAFVRRARAHMTCTRIRLPHSRGTSNDAVGSDFYVKEG